MGSGQLAEERALAVLAVERACRVCASVQARLPPPLEKHDRSPVTVADFAAQAVVALTLAERLPGVGLLAEESAGELRGPGQEAFLASVVAEAAAVLPGLDEERVLRAIERGVEEPLPPRRWVLDPLDGTKGFLRREQYAVALALLEDGRVTLGLLGCPGLPHDPARPEGPRGCLFVAEAGQGSVWRPLQGGPERAIEVDRVVDPAGAVLCESVESGHSSHQASSQVLAALGARAAPRRLDSQCKYALVARGEASIYLRLPARPDYVEKVWDHAAGALIVEEAGGRVTDLAGAPLDFSCGRAMPRNRGVVASNRAIHQRVLAAAQRAAG